MVYRLRPEKVTQPQSKSSLAEDIARVPLQAGIGALSAAPGWVGNTFEGINDLIAAPITKAITGKSVPYEETYLGKALPTTQTHRKNIDEAIPYLKPKNRIEKFANDVAGDTVELFSPGKVFKMGKYALSPLLSLGISLFGNTTGEGIYQWTGDQSKADMVKSASMIMASLINPMTANQVKNDLYNQANSLLPSGAKVNANNLNSSLTNLESQVLKNRSYNQLAPSERFVVDEVNKIRQSTQSGNVDVDTLVAMKRSLNETLSQFVFDVKDPNAKIRAKSLAKNLIGYLKDTLSDYGKSNPKWWEIQQAADKANGAIAKSNFVSRILEKFMKGRPEGMAHLFGIGIPAGVSFFSPIGGGVTALGYQAAKIGTRIAKSPELAKHYAKVTAAALAENPKIIHKELDEMEKELKKEKKVKYRLKPQ